MFVFLRRVQQYFRQRKAPEMHCGFVFERWMWVGAGGKKVLKHNLSRPKRIIQRATFWRKKKDKLYFSMRAKWMRLHAAPLPIHTDGLGVRMPFSALSLSKETDCPFPSLLSVHPSCSVWFWAPDRLQVFDCRSRSGSFPADHWQGPVSVFSRDTFTSQQLCRGNAFKQRSPRVFTFTWEESFHIVQ